jgi:hypothetical protein
MEQIFRNVDESAQLLTDEGLAWQEILMHHTSKSA